ncbi:unnamed protein product [Brugia timori]|uniref:Uncharacterized protein n=1 Tax=Brugia timori TaxID=42155 RepID=A0A3P7XBT2_9BILA|nr:unnamed protein product [Brugia timori]
MLSSPSGLFRFEHMFLLYYVLGSPFSHGTHFPNVFESLHHYAGVVFHY